MKSIGLTPAELVFLTALVITDVKITPFRRMRNKRTGTQAIICLN